MSAEQATALIVAATGMIVAVTACFAQLRQTHALLDGRMTALLEQTKLASQKTGELDGRDLEAARSAAVPIVAEQIAQPTQRLPPNK